MNDFLGAAEGEIVMDRFTENGKGSWMFPETGSARGFGTARELHDKVTQTGSQNKVTDHH